MPHHQHVTIVPTLSQAVGTAGAAPECTAPHTTSCLRAVSQFPFPGSENQQLAIEVAARVLPQLLRLCQNLGRKGFGCERTCPAVLAHLHSCLFTVLTSAAPAAIVLAASVPI